MPQQLNQRTIPIGGDEPKRAWFDEYARSDRGILEFATVAAANAWAADAANAEFAVPGRHAWVTAENAVYVRSSGAWRVLGRAGDGVWQDYTPTWEGLNLGGAGAVNVGKFARLGDTVRATGRVVLGTGGSASGQFTFTAPTNVTGPDMATGVNIVGHAFCPNGAVGQRFAYLTYGGSNNLIRLHVSSNDTRWGVGTPTAWAAAAQLSWQISYQAA